MKFKMKLILMIVYVFCIFPFSALANYIAYAESETKWGSGVGTTQNEANKIALERCNDSTKDNCILDETKAIVFVVNKNGDAYLNKSTTAAAKEEQKRAFERCGEASCKLEALAKEPGFYVLSGTRSEEGEFGNLFLQYGGIDRKSTINRAISGCKGKGGDDCLVIWIGAISGNVEIDNMPGSEVKKNTKQDSVNCRPQASTLKCHSQCVNGNCIVTYENGCKMRVQVQPKFNGFSNSWEYPSPGC
ncbi:hypothetical protein [Klebsiella grimontii]|uniref:hypothetical protein n=1 Tax=Klebsiella grimontii TaxID=2058152 RepID=UPI00300DBA6A